MGLDIDVLKPIKLSKEEQDKFFESGNYLEVDDIKDKLLIFSDFFFKKTQEYLNFEQTFKNLGITEKCNGHGFKREVEDDENSSMGVIFFLEGEKKTRFIKLEDIVRFDKEVTMIHYESVGYQRKGANKLFYDNKEWDEGGCITTLEKLNEHWDKYFSSDNEDRNNFKRNIINKFIEGETFVIYW